MTSTHTPTPTTAHTEATPSAAGEANDALTRAAARRLAGIGAIASAVAFLVALLVLPGGDAGESAGAIASRYSDGSRGYLIASAVEGLSVALFVVFVAGLRTALSDGGLTRALSNAATIGAAIAAALQLVGYAVIATLAYGTAENASPDVIVALYDLSSIAYGFSGFGLAVFFLAGGAVMIRTAAVPRALGLAAVVLGALSLMAAGSLAHAGAFSVHEGVGFLTFALMYLWLLAAGIVMLRRRAA